MEYPWLTINETYCVSMMTSTLLLMVDGENEKSPFAQLSVSL